MKILLPVDGSDYTKRTLAYLAAHPELLPGVHEYLACTVVPALPAHVTRFLDEATLAADLHDQAEAVLAPVRGFARMHHWQLREVVSRGHAAETVAELARKERPDLVVMGSHGRTALGNVALGSVATGVLARCEVPVLLIR